MVMHMVSFDELLYLPLDLPTPPKDFFQKLIKHLEIQNHDVKSLDTKLDIDQCYYDEYRNSGILHLTDRAGNLLNAVTDFDTAGEMAEWYNTMWDTFAPTRSALTITMPGDVVPPHIDCAAAVFHKPQHKLRYVVQAEVPMQFLTDKEYISPAFPWIDSVFVFSGKWPHMLTNNSNKNVYIFTMGSPWESSLTNSKYVDLLNRSYIKNHEYYISNADITLPHRFWEMFETKYQ